MKRLDEIEHLSMLELDKIAMDRNIVVPSTLKRDIAVTARALEVTLATESTTTHKEKRWKRLRLAAYPAAAVAVIAIGLGLGFYSIPKDTFNDPMTAYMQMEQVMDFISQKMNTGLEMAYAAEPVFEKTINALK